jgi:DNA-binding transcriptional MerR regulator
MPTPSGNRGVIRILHELDMPPEDIRALLAAGDPMVVHRYIELHGERLEERLADRLQTLVRLERTLNDAILEHGPASRRPSQPEMTSQSSHATRTRKTSDSHVAAPTRRVLRARSGLERVTQGVSDGPQ